MVGIDASATAIVSASATGSATYEVSPLSTYDNPSLFDVVICLDVLFHIVDNEEWHHSLTALMNSVRPGGFLLIIEHFGVQSPNRPPHVKWRSMADYRDCFSGTGFTPMLERVYQSPHEGVDKTLIAARKSLSPSRR